MRRTLPVQTWGSALRRALLSIALLAGFLAPASASGGQVTARPPRQAARVVIDGRLRPGHLETIRVRGFPGRGRTEVAFFPTAICGKECAAATRPGSVTNDSGAASFAVRTPGTFIAQNGKHVYFRNGERVELEVLWNGPHKSFDVADANPEPIIVRSHGSRHG